MKKKISFEDNKKRVVKIPAKETIDDLVKKWGVTGIKITSPKEPLKDGWWREKRA